MPTQAEETKDLSDQQKREQHRAKRRAQAAARKERKRKEKETTADARAGAAQRKRKAEDSRAPSMEVEMMQFDDRSLAGSSVLPTLDFLAGDTPDVDDHRTPSRPYSPVPVVGSVDDVQAYFADAAMHDASEYNTENEEPADGEHDGSSVGGGDVGIDEELARLA